MGQQRLRGAGARFKPTRTFPSEESVASQVTIGMGLSDVPEFLARHVGLVEGNVHGCKPVVCEEATLGRKTQNFCNRKSRTARVRIITP